MFILSIIPLGLHGGNKEIPSSEGLKKETKIKDLEAFLTAGILGHDVSVGLGTYEVNPNGMSLEEFQKITEQERKDCEERKAMLAKETGINLSDLGEVQNEIEKLRQEELKLLQDSGFHKTDSATERLSEIRNNINVSEQRLRDLNGLKDAVVKGEEFDSNPDMPGVQGVSNFNVQMNPGGVYDISIIEQEIHRVETYEKALKDSHDFWKQISGPDEKTNTSSSETSGDLKSDKTSEGSKMWGAFDDIPEANPFDIKNFGAGFSMLIGEDLKPEMSEKEFRDAAIKHLEMQTGIPAEPSRVAAINTLITAIKNGMTVPGYKGDGRTQFAFLLNLWKYPNQPLPRR